MMHPELNPDDTTQVAITATDGTDLIASAHRELFGRPVIDFYYTETGSHVASISVDAFADLTQGVWLHIGDGDAVALDANEVERVQLVLIED